MIKVERTISGESVFNKAECFDSKTDVEVKVKFLGITLWHLKRKRDWKFSDYKNGNGVGFKSDETK